MSDNTFPVVWFGSLQGKEKEELKNILLNSRTAFTRFVEILEAYNSTLEQEEISEKHFTTPEWQTRQAFILGQKRAYRDILRLFSFLNK